MQYTGIKLDDQLDAMREKAAAACAKLRYGIYLKRPRKIIRSLSPDNRSQVAFDGILAESAPTVLLMT